MFRNDFKSISDDEFVKICEPFDDKIDDYILNNILYDFVAFYIATGYQLNSLWEGRLRAHVNSAIETLSGIEFKKTFDDERLAKILEEKYGLVITCKNPLKFQK